jgi:hypothetical protein
MRFLLKIEVPSLAMRAMCKGEANDMLFILVIEATFQNVLRQISNSIEKIFGGNDW